VTHLLAHLAAITTLVLAGGLAMEVIAPKVADECNTGCNRCPRTNPSFQCGAQPCDGQGGRPSAAIVYTNLGGQDGCCYHATLPTCASIPCKWTGTFSVVINAGGPVDVSIEGPGAKKKCTGVGNGQFCTKSFDDGLTYPSIVASCPNDSVLVGVWVGNQSCCMGMTFTCGACTVPPVD